MKQRKNRLKNYLKFGVFLFGISLILWNCEKETHLFEQQEVLNLNNSEKYIKLNQRKTLQHLKSKIRKFNITNKATGFNEKFGIPQFNEAVRIKIVKDSDSTNLIVTPLIKTTKGLVENKILISYIKGNRLNHKIFLDKEYIKNNRTNSEKLILPSLSFIYNKLFGYNKSNLNRDENRFDCDCGWLAPPCLYQCDCGTYLYTIYYCDEKGDNLDDDDTFDWDAWNDDIDHQDDYYDSDNWDDDYNDGDDDYNEDDDWYFDGDSGSDEDDQIINNLTGKADCTYGKLHNNTLLKKTLERFVGVGTPVHLILEQKSNLREDDTNPNSPLVNGKTYYGLSYYITIKLNTEQANNRPSLAVARTILHEAIHAEIFRKMKTTSGLLYRPNMIPHYVMPNGSRPNFPTLFDAYNNYPNNPHHNFMANYYRNAIVNGLKEYAQSIGESHTDQFYKDMAWSGLLDTQAWNNQYADPVYAASEKTRIQNVINNYDNSHNNECQ